MEIRRLFPDAGTLEAARALDDLRLGDAAPHDRPYVVAYGGLPPTGARRSTARRPG